MGWEDDAVLLRDFGGDVCMPAYISIVVLTELQGLARSGYALAIRRHHLTPRLEGRQVIIVRRVCC